MTQAEAEDTPWVPPDTFALRLVVLRKHLKLSGPKVARRCGIAPSTWANWEQGAIPSNMAEVAQQIADALGVDRQWLLYGAGDIGAYHLPYEQLTLADVIDRPDGEPLEWMTRKSLPATGSGSHPAGSLERRCAATSPSSDHSPAGAGIAA